MRQKFLKSKMKKNELEKIISELNTNIKDSKVNDENKELKELKETIKKLELENKQEIKNNELLCERNKKLEFDLIKANEELDQYEMECKEADIEIESLKMRIGELVEEIKKMKHIETIEETLEENNETDEKEDDDNKDNNNNSINNSFKNDDENKNNNNNINSNNNSDKKDDNHKE